MEIPDLDKLREAQAQHPHSHRSLIHDSRLIDRLRMLSNGIDQFLGSVQKAATHSLAEQILQILVELKHF